ncbi:MULTISPECIES: DUF1203 domain-containing protein [unclassified Pseudoalteromonas]|uniref:DUF1203 domain-containing protein n=1 Tax=unclassified Pseudoalteromonas TaxID=194690 RepID=UPI002096B348|nr:DUF1203 domain-containing protein [Pseudoalteromonas sp. XMcav2-N]MCO7188558.1 DUF1203 domain-containing protein [Pseudoalteromonas sp. XMcav2-N]
MKTDFKISGIDKHSFSELLNLNEQELESHNAKWITADANPGYPCRVSLIEANIGERVLVLPYLHHNADSPYRASGPIFVRENAIEAKLDINEIPEILRKRQLSIRAYNKQQIMIHAEILQGSELAPGIRKQLSNHEVEYIHIHNANPGCFNCSVHRA